MSNRCFANTIDREKTIMWIDSYQSGYAWSDAIERGLRSVLDRTDDVRLMIHHMDTKNCQTPQCLKQSTENTLAVIKKIKPDIIIASDDIAQKYVVVPHLIPTGLPVVFCGVNWDASIYGYPTSQITGMIEIELAEETISHMRRFSKGNRIGCISGDTVSDRKNIKWLNKKYFNGKMIVHRVQTFEDFKQKFLWLQENSDMLFIRNNTAISGWDDFEAKVFIEQHLKIPTASNNEWMAPFVIFTLAKKAEEQGEYAANTALKILKGKKPGDIPITVNKKARLTVNLDMAKVMDIVFPLSVLKFANIIGSYSTPESEELDRLRNFDFTGKRVLWVDSYHAGYEWSDGIEAGIRQIFANTPIKLKIVRMNSKRQKLPVIIQEAAKKAKETIDQFNPDVLIASDDNAQKYLIVPYFKNSNQPVVFCGINEKPEKYGYPTKNITGMVEITPFNRIVNLLEPYAGGKRIGFLAGNTHTQQIQVPFLNKTYFQGKLKSYLVNTWTEFKGAFLNAQQDVDILLFANYAGIKNWLPLEAEAFVRNYTKIPTGTANHFMNQFVVATLAKFPDEHGRFSAITALKILNGQHPEDLQMVESSQYQLTLNMELAQRADIIFPLSVLKKAKLIKQDSMK